MCRAARDVGYRRGATGLGRYSRLDVGICLLRDRVPLCGRTSPPTWAADRRCRWARIGGGPCASSRRTGCAHGRICCSRRPRCRFLGYTRHYLLVQIYQPKYGLAHRADVDASRSVSFTRHFVRVGAAPRHPRVRWPAVRSSWRARVVPVRLAWHLVVVTTRSTDAVARAGCDERLVRARHPLLAVVRSSATSRPPQHRCARLSTVT